MTGPQRKARSIQSRLVLLLLFVLVPVLGIEAYMYYDDFQSLRASAVQSNMEMARAVAAAFDSFVQDVIHQEHVIGIALTSKRVIPQETATPMLETHQEYPALREFSWLNPKGVVVSSSNPTIVGQDLSGRSYFREIAGGREWVVGELVIGKKTGFPLFGISRGIRDERGALLGVVVATVIPERLDAVLAVERAKGGGFAIVDKNGMLVYRFPAIKTSWEERNWLKQYPQFAEALQGKETAAKVYAAYDGKDRLVSFAPIPSIRWAASADVREEEIIGPILGSIARNALLFLCIAIAAFLIAVLVSRRIAKPVLALRNHAQALGRGEQREQVKISNVSEFQDLAEAFNAMAEKVRGREMALRESEQRWATTLASIGDAVIAADNGGRIAFMNTVAEGLTGWPFHEAVKQEVTKIFHIINEHTREAVENPVDKVLRTGAFVGLANHTVLVRKDGTEIPIDDSGAPIKDRDGHTTGVVLVFRDITERKKTEEELRKAHERAIWLARFPEENPNPVMRVSDQEIILYCNPACAEDAAWACEVGQQLGSLLVPLFRRAMAEGRELEEDVKMGEKFYSVSVFPFPTENYANIYGRDITQRKRAEEALQKSNARAKLLSETAGRLLATDNPQGIVNELCHDVMAYLDCQAFFNFIVDDTLGRLHLNAYGGIPEEEAKKIEWLDYGAAICGCAARERRPIVAEHIPTTPDVRTELVKSFGIKAYAAHPLRGPEGKVIGTLSFGTRSRENFSEDDLSLMKAVADQVAIAVERMRLIREIQASRDLLGIKVAERTAELTKQSRILEGFFKSTITPLVFLDKNFNFIRVNEAYAKSCHRDMSEFPGHNHFEFYPHEENEAIFRRVVQTKVPYEAIAKPFSFPDHPEGGITYWDWTLTPLLDDKDEVEFLVFSLEDVTKRKTAELALEEASRYARSLIEASIDPLVTISRNGKIMDVNRATELATGVSRDTLIGSDFSGYFTEPEKARQGYEQVFSKGSVSDYALAIRHTSGRVMEVLYNATVFKNEAGEVEGVFAAARDVTERKRAEEALITAHHELREEMAKREKVEQQLRQAQKMEAIGTLTGGIAHDLNNILAPVIINSEMALLDADGDPKLRNSLEMIHKSGLRGKDLVKQLLLFSRKSEKKQEIITLPPLVKESFKLLRASIPTTIQMKLHLETDTDSIYADPSQIHQVIMNLCTNAAYSMRGKTGSIDISLRAVTFSPHDLPEPDMEPGDYLVLSVKDTGCGMGEDVRKRVFEPFFTTKPPGEGTGLGLAVVYGIVKNHKGNITVYSELDKGSIFNVYLPQVETKSQEEGEVMTSIPRGDERILLVDDEEFMISTVKSMLEHLGYKVTGLLDSRQALNVFAADPSQFDLVMTDQTMPNMTGENLGKEAMRVRPDIPVILCTGYADLISSEKAKEMGFRGFIMKPFTVREAADLIRRVLDRNDFIGSLPPAFPLR